MDFIRINEVNLGPIRNTGDFLVRAEKSPEFRTGLKIPWAEIYVTHQEKENLRRRRLSAVLIPIFSNKIKSETTNIKYLSFKFYNNNNKTND